MTITHAHRDRLVERDEAPCCPQCYTFTGESLGLLWDPEEMEFICPRCEHVSDPEATTTPAALPVLAMATVTGATPGPYSAVVEVTDNPISGRSYFIASVFVTGPGDTHKFVMCQGADTIDVAFSSVRTDALCIVHALNHAHEAGKQEVAR